MGRPLIDLTGMRFGSLTVIERYKSDSSRPLWRCACDCGVETHSWGHNLRAGGTKTCGTGEHKASYKHGLCGRESKDKFYNTWSLMKHRCNNSEAQAYKNYGGRGISVCDEWEESEPFIVWAKENYIEGYTLDRIDVNGDYSPSNCRYASWATQCTNRRSKEQLAIDNAAYAARG
jgi:hypothetical protein